MCVRMDGPLLIFPFFFPFFIFFLLFFPVFVYLDRITLLYFLPHCLVFFSFLFFRFPFFHLLGRYGEKRKVYCSS